MPFALNKPPARPEEHPLVTISLCLIFIGLLLLVIFAVYLGAWGLWFNPIPLRWLVASIALTTSGCVVLMLYDACWLLKRIYYKIGKIRRARCTRWG